MTPRAWGELGLLGLIWGGSFLGIRVALDEIGVLSVVAHRTFWAMLALWGVVAWRRRSLPRGWRVWAAFLVMGLLNNVIPFGLMAWGQLHIASGLTAILNATTAFWGVLVAAALFPDERLTPRRLAGIGLGLAGVALALGPAALAGFDPANLAQWAVLVGTFSYACAGAWARVHLSRLPPDVAAAGMLTGASLVLVPLAIAVEGRPDFSLTAGTWGALAYVALIATAGAYLLYYRVLAMAGAGNLMLVTLLIPPVAIVLGAAVRGETLTPGALGGFVLLGLGLWVLNRRPRPGPTTAA